MKRAHPLAVIGFLLALHAPAASEETLRIAVGEFPPYLAERQISRGIAAQIIREIFATEGLQVEFEFLPWSRAYEDTLEGRYDATGIWLKLPEREASFFFSAPLIKEKHVFFHLKTRAFSWNSLGDLQGLRIGGISHFSYGATFDQAIASGKIKMDRANTDVQNFKKLLAGRIDLYPQEVNVGCATLRGQFPAEDLQRITYHPRPFLETENHLLFPKSRSRSLMLLAIFNAGLKRLKKSGRYHAIFAGNALAPSP